MARSEADLARGARRAYELGRVSAATPLGLLVAPVACLGLLNCARPGATLACIVLLTTAVVALQYRGLDWARGARLGLLAGIGPFLVPIGAQALGLFCSPRLCAALPWVCVAGGLLGGMALGSRGRGSPTNRSAFWTAAIGVTLLAGSIGCLLAGLAGVAGLVLGLAIGAAPVLLLRST
jgi:hypothetical protein